MEGGVQEVEIRRDHLLIVGRAELDVVEGGAGRQQLDPAGRLLGMVRIEAHGAVWGDPQHGGPLVHVLSVGMAVSLLHGLAHVTVCIGMLNPKHIRSHCHSWDRVFEF